jgi:hypothetical protein
VGSGGGRSRHRMYRRSQTWGVADMGRRLQGGREETTSREEAVVLIYSHPMLEIPEVIQWLETIWSHRAGPNFVPCPCRHCKLKL